MGHRRQSQRFALRLKPVDCLFVGSPAHEAVKLGAIVIYQADSAESEVIHTPARAASHHGGDDRNALLSPRQRQANRCTFARDRFGTVHHPLAHPVSEATRCPADTGNKRLGQEATRRAVSDKSNIFRTVVRAGTARCSAVRLRVVDGVEQFFDVPM